MTVEPIPPVGKGRCGCNATQCNCTIRSTPTVTVIGSGNEDDPYSFIAAATIAMSVVDSATVNLTLSGSGSVGDPYILSGVATIPGSPTVAIYLSDGVYGVPTWATAMQITAIGGGGGGGYGAGSATAALRYGGFGGGGGALTEMMVDPLVLDTPLAITIGGGGQGADESPATSATNGGATTIFDNSGALVARASGGSFGNNGTVGSVPAVSGAGGTIGNFTGGGSDAAGVPATRQMAPTAGGHGAVLNAAGAVSIPATTGGNRLAVGVVAPGANTGGTGGATGAAGSAGNNYGGGGGGGGASTVAASGGAGGAGAPGYVRIAVW